MCDTHGLHETMKKREVTTERRRGRAKKQLTTHECKSEVTERKRQLSVEREKRKIGRRDGRE